MSSLIVLVPVGLLLAALAMARPRSRPREDLTREAVDAIDSLLPQTQCGQCGFPGCRPYAEALVEGRARANQCPPGGLATMRAIARLVGGEAGGLPPPPEPAARVALIDESLCIGCLKCIKACPVDAIIGAKGMMHTIIRQDCTGCELCVAPCPVDCISMEPVRPRTREWVWSKPGALT